MKALDDEGVGTYSGVIAAMAWIEENLSAPTVVSCSIGGTVSELLNDAVDDLHDAGATVVVAAGNTATDACDISPASAEGAITVGATTSTDLVADYSAFGTCVDIYAPGSSVLSALTGTSSDYVTLSGTSMACPHVSGVAALVLSLDETIDVKAALECSALPGLLESVDQDAWADDAERVMLQLPMADNLSCE
jgi:serine protease